MKKLSNRFIVAFAFLLPLAANADDLDTVKAFSKAADSNDIETIDKLLTDDYVSEAPAPAVGADLPQQSRAEMMTAMRNAFKTMNEMGMTSTTEILNSEEKDGGLVVRAINHNKVGDRQASTESTILYKFDGDKISATKMLEVKSVNEAP